MKLLVLLGFLALASAKSFEDVVKQTMLEYRGNGQHWAVLVAGSRTWGNYRHQADICHAYHVLRNNGIPESNIIVMMYDDIAHNSRNPNPGTIINHPNGRDVYRGVPRDYTGQNCNPTNFLRILQGQMMVDENGLTIGSGKTINSGPNDHIFVNFADHGGPGIVCFPAGGYLHSSDWNRAIKNMHQNRRYGQMVIYVEACESGSMFENILPSNINVFATTAANAHESSYACYYDSRLQTCLGDLYSVNWMENSDRGLGRETLEQQYQTVKRKTTQSHVMQFGTTSLASEHVSAFQGEAAYIDPDSVPVIDLPPVEKDPIPAPDVPVVVLKRRLVDADTPEEEKEISKDLKDLLMQRRSIKNLFKRLVKYVVKESANEYTEILETRENLNDHHCYKSAVDHFHDNCLKIHLNEHSLRYLYTFVNLCERGYSQEQIKDAMRNICTSRF